MEKLNLYQKLLTISGEIGVVPKNLTISLGGGKYKAVGEIDVITAVKPLEIKYGVLSLPIAHEVIESKELEKKDGRIEQFVRIKTTFRFIDVENPSEFIDTTAIGDGVDSGDKASGKAQTYADKYALLKAYKIATGEDPDNDPSDDYKKPKKDPIKNDAKATVEEKPPFMDQFTTYGERTLAVEKITKLLSGDAGKVAQWLNHYGVTAETLTPSVADTIIARIKAKQNK